MPGLALRCGLHGLRTTGPLVLRGTPD